MGHEFLEGEYQQQRPSDRTEQNMLKEENVSYIEIAHEGSQCGSDT